MSDSVQPHRWQPIRLHHPWDSPGKNTGVGCHFLLQCMKVKSESEVIQSCPTLQDPMDCSLPGSSVHGIFQARVLEWGAIPLNGGDRNGCLKRPRQLELAGQSLSRNRDAQSWELQRWNVCSAYVWEHYLRLREKNTCKGTLSRAHPGPTSQKENLIVLKSSGWVERVKSTLN